MSYILFKLLPGGTFTPGVGADWRGQFGAATIVSARPTIAGEVSYTGSGTAFGVYAAFAFEAKNPFDATICVPEASAGSPVQIYLNGVLVAEVASPGTAVCSAWPGVNVFEAVRGCAPLVVMPAGTLIDPRGKTGAWVSLYPADADPFSTGSPLTAATVPNPL
ncbi:MAG TPA: hypothetical protein VMI31_17940 [Fimbriimonadaceae bacterium]|nr:hypothetical protein [Fimbriimonadaceae bacterium]